MLHINGRYGGLAVQQFQSRAPEGLAVAAALVVSTLVAIAVTGWVMAKLSGRGRP